jgi:hypothetical protein
MLAMAKAVDARGSWSLSMRRSKRGAIANSQARIVDIQAIPAGQGAIRSESAA